jgi:hypothetical protein
MLVMTGERRYNFLLISKVFSDRTVKHVEEFRFQVDDAPTECKKFFTLEHNFYFTECCNSLLRENSTEGIERSRRLLWLVIFLAVQKESIASFKIHCE